MKHRMKILSVMTPLMVILKKSIVLAVFLCMVPPLYGRTGVDSIGNRITVPDNTVRIVSLSPGATETLFAIGLKNQIVGISDFCNYPPDFVKTKSRMGGFSTPNIEKIQAVFPHVVILSTVVPLSIKNQFDHIGIQLFVYEPKNFNMLLSTIEQFGRLFHREQCAQALVLKLKTNAGTIVQAVRKNSVRPVRTFIEIYYDPLYGAGRNSLPGDLVTLAGGEVIPATHDEYPRLNEESLLVLNPEAIILGHNTDLEQFMKIHRNISNTAAMKNRKIFVPDPDEFLRPGPRVINALQEIAEFLHPEAF